MLKSVIIEDEAQNLERLVNLLQKHCPEVAVSGHASGVKTGFETISRLRPDLVFMDIQLTDGTGFDLLKMFDEIPFRLIFVTAYESYAVKAFRFSALDYLLKPVDPDELIEAVDKVKTESFPQDRNLLNQAAQNFSSKDFDKLVLRDFDNVHLVELNDITYGQADGNYTRFHFTASDPIMVSKSLKEYETLLQDSGFFRIHRSYLINLKHFKLLKKSEGGDVVLSDGSVIPVGAGKKEELISFLEQFKG